MKKIQQGRNSDFEFRCDSPGRAITEALLAHIRSIMGLERFTLRTKMKVDIQWKLL